MSTRREKLAVHFAAMVQLVFLRQYLRTLRRQTGPRSSPFGEPLALCLLASRRAL
jgi:hypothetical protein